MPVRTISRLSEITWRSPRCTKHGKIKNLVHHFPPFPHFLCLCFPFCSPCSLFSFPFQSEQKYVLKNIQTFHDTTRKSLLRVQNAAEICLIRRLRRYNRRHSRKPAELRLPHKRTVPTMNSTEQRWS